MAQGITELGCSAASARITQSALLVFLLPVLIFIAVSDIKRYEIPNFCSIMILILGVWGACIHSDELFVHITGGMVMGGILLAVYVITGGRGIGGGDIKLMTAAGILLGADDILWAFLTAGILALCVHLPRKRLKMQNRIAFAPYLATGIWVMAVFHYT